MKKVLLKIDGMTCSACSSGLEKYLNKQEGIKVASVNLIMNNAIQRNQVPGSISFVPSVAGLILAGEVVKDIINYK